MAEDVKVPEGWRRVRLGEISEIVKGITYKSSDYCESEEGATFINLKCILKKGGFNKDGLKYFKGLIRESQILRKGDIIIAIVDLTRDGDIIGYPLRVPDFGSNKVVTMSMDVVKIEPDAQIDKAFLYYRLCLNDIHSYILSISAGSTVLHLDLNWLPQLEFSVPLSLPEQHKIAEILETLDNTIEKTDAIIEKYKHIKQGLMQDLLTRGIDENGQIRSEETHRFRDSPLGRIPEEWKVVELGEVCEINPEKVEYSSIKIVKYIDIESVKDGKITTYKIFTKNNAPSRAQRLVKEKDIIVSTVRPNLKSFAIVTKEFDNFVCSTGFAVLRAKEEKVHPTYLFYLTFYDDVFLAQILPIIVGSNYPAINSYDVYELIIPLPPLPEQKRIASILSQIDKTIEKEQKYKEKLGRIKRGLMEDLLTGKVRVNHLIEEGERNEN